MDKNTIIGMLLMVAVFIGFMLYNQPSQEDLARQRKIRDSLEQVNAQKYAKEKQQALEEAAAKDSLSDLAPDSLSQANDSLRLAESFGKFAPSASGISRKITLQNSNIKVEISTKGAMVQSVELKNYKTRDSLPLILFDEKTTLTGLDFFSGNNAISTPQLYFEYQGDSLLNADGKDVEVVFRAYTVDRNSYLEFSYKLPADGFLLDFNISYHNLDKVINTNSSYMDLNWNQYLKITERGNDWELQNTGLYYKYVEDDMENLGFGENESENLKTPLKWIAFKGQFFSSVLIAKSEFVNGYVSSSKPDKFGTLRNMQSKIGLNSDFKTDSLCYFFGPNQCKVLSSINMGTDNSSLHLEKLIYLGWGIFGWINSIAIIPLFNMLGSFISSYGLIILILTIIIKLVIFPLTFKSYQSSAKMRVLKPQVEQLTKKFKPEQAMEKQQATMALYKRAGVNPMGGCLPVLLQMPILIAMFRFFPASIELRGESFLWAKDLSSYDSIIDLPFSIPFYGDHVSLFTLLMALAIVVSTKINSSQMEGQSMPGMKMMMYLMPVMMVFWFNNYSSGLSYYYLLSNIITIGQTLIIRRFVDEQALLEKLNAKADKNAKTPKKKGGFLDRLQEMQKQQLKEQQKKNKR